MRYLKHLLLAFFFCGPVFVVVAQDINSLPAESQFLSYQRIPTWAGVIINWKYERSEVHLYDYNKYYGHAEYISRGLQLGINFREFKALVHDPKTRSFLPIFLFDLRKNPIEHNGKTYEWAVRIEDYRYKDTPEQMAATVEKLHKTLAKHINSSARDKTKILIVLSRSAKAQPNFKIEELLNERGIEGISLSGLLSKVGSPKVEILNIVTAVGKLRYVAADEMDSTFYSPTDIVIFEQLPHRVPPVSGIITLEPQTPLSHVNLLAINRGTLNLYALSLDDLPGAQEKIGHLVKIKIKHNKLTISEISLAQAGKHWAKHKPPRVEIPTPLLEQKEIIDLRSPDNVQTSTIGAKASNYALLQRNLSKHVKPGHALPFSWYYDVTSSPSIQEAMGNFIRNKKYFTSKQIAKELETIRSLIRSQSIDKAKMMELRSLITASYPDTRIRLRSSTNCEDLAEFNGAGLYLSKGFNTHEHDSILERKLLQVYASLWTPHAFAEREFYGIDHNKAAMAVLIHEAFPDEFANGVVLTIPNQDTYSILVNSQIGDHSVTNPEHGHIPESILFSSKNHKDTTIQSHSSIGAVFQIDSIAHVLQELITTTEKVHKLVLQKAPTANQKVFGVDIEFKLMREKDGIKLYIKQARLLGIALPD